MQKLGWFGGLGVTQGHQKHRHLIECIDFIFDFNRNYASILYRFRVIALSVKSGQFLPIPTAFVAPVGGDPIGISPLTSNSAIITDPTDVFKHLEISDDI